MGPYKPEIYRILILLLAAPAWLFAQNPFHNYQSDTLYPDTNTHFLSDSILHPDYLVFTSLSGKEYESDCFELIPNSGKLKRNSNCQDTVVVHFKLIGQNVETTYSLRDSSQIYPLLPESQPQTATEIRPEWAVFPGLESKGSITRGVTTGSNQGVGLDARMNITLSGNLSENTTIEASIHDENLPGQSEGYTQQLQEFDQVSIKIRNPDFTLTGGDYSMRNQEFELGSFDKKTAGIYAQAHPDSSKWILGAGAGISRGQYALNQFNGIEGNQGPYKLVGNKNEAFILIISGTERVFIDGKRLTRGENQDYVIDYNAAEIRFTPNQPITREKRISVEFQYADRNYARFLTGLEAQTSYESGSTEIVYIQETEAKNQSLQQNLSLEDRNLLAASGDQDPVLSSVNPANFSPEGIFYAQKDSLGFTDILIYSTNPNDSLFTASFRFVGQGKGDYVRAGNEVNGIVYAWRAPVNGVQQGNYAPERILIAPVQQAQLMIKNQHFIGENLASYLEFGRTQTDENRFSNLDSGDDISHAVYLGLGSRKNQAFEWKSRIGLFQTNFNPFEDRFAVEYNRDWNLSDSLLRRRMVIGSLDLAWETDSLNRIFLQSEVVALDAQQGLKQNLELNQSFGENQVNYKGAYLINQGLNRGSFYRHLADLKTPLGSGYFLFGESLFENNQAFVQATDSLSPRSFGFHDWKTGIGYDTTDLSWSVGYQNRKDALPSGSNLISSGTVNALHFNLNRKWPNQTWTNTAVYRELSIPDSTQRLASLTARSNFIGTYVNRQLSVNGRVETSSGQEPERVFSYIEVQPGQGQYGWVDYNGNGIQEIDEFVIAPLQDTANYIRVFSATTNYLPVSRGLASVSLAWVPQINSAKPLFWKRFSNQFQALIDHRIFQTGKGYEQAFIIDAPEAVLGQSSNVKNQLFFNRSRRNFTAFYAWQNSNQIQILGYGKESRQNLQHEWMARKHLGSGVFIIGKQTFSRTENESGNFASRSFRLSENLQSLELEWQQVDGHVLSFELGYNHGEEEEQNLNLDRYQTRLAYTYQGQNGAQVNSAISYIENAFSGNPNNQAAFELLDGLNPGGNLQWELGWNQTISSRLQASLSYFGRGSEGQTIHTGSARLRLFF